MLIILSGIYWRVMVTTDVKEKQRGIERHYTCVVCSTSYTTPRYSKVQICSDKCRSMLKRKGVGGLNSVQLTRKCNGCQFVYKAGVVTQKYCSVECKKLYRDSKAKGARQKSKRIKHVEDFYNVGGFHEDTVFTETDKRDRFGYVLWQYDCGDCGATGEAPATRLKRGQKSCLCSVQSQQEAYINLILDDDLVVAIKFGVARDSNQRVKQQNSKSVYEIIQHAVYVKLLSAPVRQSYSVVLS